MSRYGLPDYGMYAALENMGNLVDHGELAARLGSPVTFNREGNLVYWDDFEFTPLKWSAILDGLGSSVALSSDTALSGGQSVKIQTGNGYLNRAGVKKYFTPILSGNIGMEMAFCVTSTGADASFKMIFDTGDMKYVNNITIDFTENELKYYDKDEGYVVFASGIQLANYAHLFHHLKTVIDVENKKPLRFLLDREEYSLNEFTMASYGGANAKYLEADITVTTLDETSKIMYLDNFILTQNEP